MFDSTEKGFTAEVAGEIEDVATLLDLVGVKFHREPMKSLPTRNDILGAQRLLIEQYPLLFGKTSLAELRLKIETAFDWFAAPGDTNEARANRAKKGAEKYGNGNVEAHYLIQLIEETGELLAAVMEANGDGLGNLQQQLELEVQKRALKVLRFGADTVIKQDGPYKGMTNQEAYEAASKAAKVSSADLVSLTSFNIKEVE